MTAEKMNEKKVHTYGVTTQGMYIYIHIHTYWISVETPDLISLIQYCLFTFSVILNIMCEVFCFQIPRHQSQSQNSYLQRVVKY